MTTFILSKYAPSKSVNENTTTQSVDNTPTEEEVIKEQQEKNMLITVNGSISEIVARALNKVFAHDEVQIQEVSEEPKPKEEGDNTHVIKSTAISSESICKDPYTSLKKINKDEVVFISSEGFKTFEEEWFLTNLPNKTSNVFLSAEKFARHIRNEFLAL